MKKKKEINSKHKISRGDFIKKAGLASAGFFSAPFCIGRQRIRCAQ